jgi:hypothetical protein
MRLILRAFEIGVKLCFYIAQHKLASFHHFPVLSGHLRTKPDIPRHSLWLAANGVSAATVHPNAHFVRG